MFGCVEFIFVSSLSISNVKALEESNIPDYMAPNTIIEYINDKDYRIIQGGEYNGTPPYDNSYIQRIKDRLNVSESDIVKMENHVLMRVLKFIIMMMVV